MRVTRIEPTPNPNAIKLNVDGQIIESGSRSFDTPAEAAGNPLASALFEIPAIRSVFFMPSFVTVSKDASADWGALAPRVAETIENNTAASSAPTEAPVETGTASEETAMLRRILEVMDTRVRPALAGDGGGLEVVGLDGHVLTIRYQGACGTCPSAITGTLRAIENMLRGDVDPAIMVVAG